MLRLFIRYAIIVCALLLVGCGVDQTVKKADKFYAVGEYYDAAAQYKKAYSSESTTIANMSFAGQIQPRSMQRRLPAGRSGPQE